MKRRAWIWLIIFAIVVTAVLIVLIYANYYSYSGGVTSVSVSNTGDYSVKFDFLKKFFGAS